MKKDIYAVEPQEPAKPPAKEFSYYSLDQQAIKKQGDSINQLKGQIENLSNELKKIDEINKRLAPVVKVQMPETQKVEVTNPPEPVQFPEKQKVEIANVNDFPKPPEVKFPDVQKVAFDPIKFPDVQSVELKTPFPEIDIPVGYGDKAGKANPEKYIPVRLTDGKKFYNAVQGAYVSAAKQSFPFVDSTGKPVQITLVSGMLPVNAQVSAQVTTASGQPLYSFQTNIPTVQSVFVTNPSSATVTTTSGTPLDTIIQNFPTVQTVNVQSLPFVQIQPGITTAVSGNFSISSVTTASGSVVDVKNFPTVQTVNVQNLPDIAGSVTTLSGSATDIKNFPTVQTVNVMNLPNVNVASLPNVTTASGSQIDVKNFPTVQTVNVLNMPGVAISSLPNVTLASGSQVDVKNFPTIQTVNVQNIPYVQIQPGITTAVSGNVTPTTVSGSPLFTFQTNIPTVQTVNVQNMPTVSVSSLPNVTTASGSAMDIKNFPTYQTVNVQNMPSLTIASLPNVTTASGSKMDISNFPTYQTVNVQNMPSVTIGSMPNVTTASGSQVDVKNFPTYQGVRLFDSGGSYLSTNTNPVTISGVVDMEGWNGVTYSGQTNGKQVVRSMAGKFGGYYYYNPNSSAAYIQVFDALQASDVTLGTTDPKGTFGVPATSAANVELTRGLKMQNGIVIAVTTTAKGSTAPTTGLDLTIYSKN